jgi:hypothetical protein
MRRDELVKQVSALRRNADVGVLIGDEYLDVADIVPWRGGRSVALRCDSVDLWDLVVDRVTLSRAVAARSGECSACGTPSRMTDTGGGYGATYGPRSADGDEHRPARPSWDCARCGRSWPCDPAREQLAAELRGTWLRIYLCIERSNAARDNPQIPAAELHERFIAWTWNLDSAQPTVDSAP